MKVIGDKEINYKMIKAKYMRQEQKKASCIV